MLYVNDPWCVSPSSGIRLAFTLVDKETVPIALPDIASNVLTVIYRASLVCMGTLRAKSFLIACTTCLKSLYPGYDTIISYSPLATYNSYLPLKTSGSTISRPYGPINATLTLGKGMFLAASLTNTLTFVTFLDTTPMYTLKLEVC